MHVESIQWSGSSSGDDVPPESVSIAFIVRTSYLPPNTKRYKRCSATWQRTSSLPETLAWPPPKQQLSGGSGDRDQDDQRYVEDEVMDSALGDVSGADGRVAES